MKTIPIRAVGERKRIDGPDDPERRRFLALMAASSALATGACSGPPQEQIVPYVSIPDGMTSGEPIFYATTLVHARDPLGVLVETNDGRPTKVEGNPAHPASLGGTDVFAQAAVLQMWDPDRSQTAYARGGLSTWEAFTGDAQPRVAQWRRAQGAGLRILVTSVLSPTLAGQLRALTTRYPKARVHRYDPWFDPAAFAGAELAFGRALDCVYRFDRPDVVVALDNDFLQSGRGHVRHARDLVSRRRAGAEGAWTRVYSVESTPGLVGAVADERLALPPGEIERVAWRIAARVGIGSATAISANPATARFESAVAQQLLSHRGASVLVAGPTLSPATHALVHALNEHLGNVGAAVRYIEPTESDAENHVESIAALATDMHAGRVAALVMLGGNPVYDAPATLGFAAGLQRVDWSVHLSLYRDETSRASTWHLPQAHAFEAWSDAQAYDGTASIVQPVTRPLHGGRSAHELVAFLVDDRQRSGHALVRDHWQRGRDAADFDAFWERVLRSGAVPDSVAPAVEARASVPSPPPTLGRTDALVAVFRPDDCIGTGDFANNAWLQEIPKPLTKIVWDNAALISPASAQQLGVASGDVITVRAAVAGGGEPAVDAPVWVLPGHADGTLTLPLGYGRTACGGVGNGLGFDAFRLRPAAPTATVPVVATRRSGRHDFVQTQEHGRMHGREILRSASLEEFRRAPQFATREEVERVPRESLYPPWSYEGYKWAMAIDLNACIGCNACTVACQAENNIPVVGKSEVARGREMHWIRVDRYFTGPDERARSAFMPVPCMQCEDAPCEEVCPVGATVHDSEGINVQVYNRCVGTRFCSNNCPYKVRRFNFLQYSSDDPYLAAQKNPEVTVRSRGVMEKCNYCLQRITRARIAGEERGERLPDGAVVTACQAACPAGAIMFGDLNDPSSRINRWRASPLNYVLLAELNTRPRTTYLARVLNPDPALADEPRR